jgi:hypothetical protein
VTLPGFATRELAAMKAEVEASMLDFCTIDSANDTAGELNEPVVEYESGELTRCRFRSAASIHNPGPAYVVDGFEGMLRLPLETLVTNRDHVTITHRLGQRLAAPMTFAVLGDPVPGLASLEVKLQAVHL